MTDTQTIERVAAMLQGLRRASKRCSKDTGIPVVAVETLLHIADGADSIAEIRRRTGLHHNSVYRLITMLRGRGRLADGKWIESVIGLVTVTRHPHRRGYRISLTPDAQELIDSTFAPLNTAGEQQS